MMFYSIGSSIIEYKTKEEYEDALNDINESALALNERYYEAREKIVEQKEKLKRKGGK